MESPEQDFQRAMMVIAHPDDGEFMASGTMAKWAREGKEVSYLVCTSGDKGSDVPDVNPTELARLREEEQRAAASVVGACGVIFLRYADGVLENTIGLRKDITREIRRFKPDIVIAMDPTAYWSARGLNHPDHRAAGAATLDAIFPSARDYHAFPDLIMEGFMPHKAQVVYIGGQSTQANHYVDITAVADIKLAALKEHRSQVGDDPTRLLEFELRIRDWMHQTGADQGMEYAEAFRRITLV